MFVAKLRPTYQNSGKFDDDNSKNIVNGSGSAKQGSGSVVYSATFTMTKKPDLRIVRIPRL